MSEDERREPDEQSSNELSAEEFADVDVFTSVKVEGLRFGIVPEVRVWFEGEPAEKSSSRSERENLPDEVEPGVTYRDVGVRWRARSRIVHPTDPD